MGAESAHSAALYLASCGAPLLAAAAPQIVRPERRDHLLRVDRVLLTAHQFDDFLVHEAAHVFHNCRRVAVGLRETRRREWLRDIAQSKRETFAYACETYSRILELAVTPAERSELLAEAEAGPHPSDARVDVDEYLDMLREAVAARNGWKRILARYAPVKR